VYTHTLAQRQHAFNSKNVEDFEAKAKANSNNDTPQESNNS